MAPGRKKGANRTKTKSKLSLGDLVLAKVKGFPAWPAKISRPEDWERIPDPKKYFVQFFGTSEIAFVAPSDIQEFTNEAKNKLSARCRGKTVKDFARAVKEICEAFEELHKKKAGDSTDEIEKTAVTELESSVDGGEDDVNMKDDTVGMEGVSKQSSGDREDDLNMRDDIVEQEGVSKPSLGNGEDLVNMKDDIIGLEGVNKQAPGDEMCGLEQCSNLQGEQPAVEATPQEFPNLTSMEICQVNQQTAELDIEHGFDAEHSSQLSGSGAQSPQVKRRRQALGPSLSSGSGVNKSLKVKGSNIRKNKPLSSDHGRSLVNHVPSKRRAVRLFDDDDNDGCTTPVHGASQNVTKDVGKSHAQENHVDPVVDNLDLGHSCHQSDVTLDVKNESLSPSPSQNEPKRRKKTLVGVDTCSPGTLGPQKPISEEEMPALGVSQKHHGLVTGAKPGEHKSVNSQSRASVTAPSKKVKAGATKGSVKGSNSTAHSHDKKATHKNGPTVSSEKSKITQENHVDHVVGDLDLGQSRPSKNAISHVKSESISLSPSQNEHKRRKKTMVGLSSCSPGSLGSKKEKSEEMPALDLSQDPHGLVTGIKPGEHKSINLQSRASATAPLNKVQTKPAKGSSKVSSSTTHSLDKVSTQKNGPTVSMEKSKITPKKNTKPSNDSFVEELFAERDRLLLERLEDGRDDKVSTSSIDTKFADSDSSMKRLIAAAQAKRREAQSQSLLVENYNSVSSSAAHVPLRSLSPDSALQSLPYNTSIASQKDGVGLNFQTSPSNLGRQIKPQQADQEENVEARVSSGHRAPGGSLSGGTEAAVARDAFEGMIETLSRTKESIGRATRLAIDCAKYGIASEVVELLIRKLESEHSSHRKVDLFFLVDSITQCSHSQKGIAGASYIPTVQAALPRLLGAAAPPGVGARENRRQCHKVLRLWLERKILPESLLRRYMDDIGVTNDDMTSGFFMKRPSRAERAIDDPIREMEGMLVDEYGSNATFQLPGLLSARVLDDEENLSGSFCNVSGDESEIETIHPSEGQETCAVTPIDRRHRILEDVDGELEMEDASGSMKDEKSIGDINSFKLDSHQQSPSKMQESTSCNLPELPPLPLGSPPLPLDSPPPPPPLPYSPPPPPPPMSPSPPPPPPPLPLQPPPPSLPVPGHLPSLTPPVSLVPQPSLPPQPQLTPQPLMPSHQVMPSQPILPPSSTPLGYQPAMHQEYSRPPNGNQHIQIAGNIPHSGHVNAPLMNNPSSSHVPAGMSSSHDPSGFTSSRPSEFGHSEMYLPPQNSQSNQQFHAGNAPFAQRPYHQVPPAQTSTSYLPYNKPTSQHHVQQQFVPSYSLPPFPDGRRQYVVDEQWKMPSGDLNPDSQHQGWLGGGRASCTGPTFLQEGFYRQPMERPPNNAIGFQRPMQNSLASGTLMPAPGHGVGHTLPCAPDISARNMWRPT